jgi:hypothetical protein
MFGSTIGCFCSSRDEMSLQHLSTCASHSAYTSSIFARYCFVNSSIAAAPAFETPAKKKRRQKRWNTFSFRTNKLFEPLILDMNLLLLAILLLAVTHGTDWVAPPNCTPGDMLCTCNEMGKCTLMLNDCLDGQVCASTTYGMPCLGCQCADDFSCGESFVCLKLGSGSGLCGFGAKSSGRPSSAPGGSTINWPLIGGAVGGGVAFILIIVIAVCAYKKRQAFFSDGTCGFF